MEEEFHARMWDLKREVSLNPIVISKVVSPVYFKIFEHQQILGSSNIQFQEQKNLNSTLTLKNHSLVQAICS